METNLGFTFEPIKFISSAFRPGGVYVRLPWISSGSSPTPPPAGTPKTAQIKWEVPWEGTRPPDVVTVVPPEQVAARLPSLSYEIAPWTAPRTTVIPDMFPKVVDTLKWGVVTNSEIACIYYLTLYPLFLVWL